MFKSTAFYLLLACLSLAGCSERAEEFGGPTMGSHYSVKYLRGSDGPALVFQHGLCGDARQVARQIERRAQVALRGREVTYVAQSAAAAFNPAFDVTPARLVTGLITERGVCAPSRDGLLGLTKVKDGEKEVEDEVAAGVNVPIQ